MFSFGGLMAEDPVERSFDMSLSELGEPDLDLWDLYDSSPDFFEEEDPTYDDDGLEEGYLDPGFSKWIIHRATGGSHGKIKQGFVYGNEDGDFCEVEVHFTGKMNDGTVFASSIENGTVPFKFLPTEGDVMQGFILAIDTMKVGEKAVFTIPAELAVGKSGSPASIPWNIPPNQDLRFDIELISLTTDVLNDKGILKKITKFGTGNKHPSDLDEVCVNFHTFLEDGTSVCKSEGVEFGLAEGFFCPAFAHAVKTMTEGEEAILIIKPEYGFGEQGKPSTGNEAAVPPDATLHVNLQLVTWKKVRYIGESQEIIMKTPHKEHDDKLILMKIPNNEDDYGFEVSTYNGAAERVAVNLIGKLQDGTVFYRSGEQPFEFAIGQENVVQGLQEAVLAMETDVASVVIPPQHAFGTVGSNEFELAVVPPNSVVIYDIELVSVDGATCFLDGPVTLQGLPTRRLKRGHKPRAGTLIVPLPPAVSSAPGSAVGESPATATSPAAGSSSAVPAEENQSSGTAQEEGRTSSGSS